MPRLHFSVSPGHVGGDTTSWEWDATCSSYRVTEYIVWMKDAVIVARHKAVHGSHIEISNDPPDAGFPLDRWTTMTVLSEE